MSFTFTNDSTVNVDSEVGTKEWEMQMIDSELNENAMRKLEDIINEVYYISKSI